MGVEQLRPPAWRYVSAVGLALAVWSILLVVGALAWSTWPAPLASPPIVVTTDRGYIVAPGVWRFETEAIIRDRCSVVMVDRLFAPIGGSARRIPPLAASVPGLQDEPASRPYVLSVEPGPISLWLEYAAVPGLHGEYVVRVEAYGCDSGWGGALSERSVSFDWRTP